MHQTTGHALRKSTAVTQRFQERGETEREGEAETGERRKRFSFTLFTHRTHHPQLEHRCLDKDNPRVGPVCTW